MRRWNYSVFLWLQECLQYGSIGLSNQRFCKHKGLHDLGHKKNNLMSQTHWDCNTLSKLTTSPVPELELQRTMKIQQLCLKIRRRQTMKLKVVYWKKARAPTTKQTLLREKEDDRVEVSVSAGGRRCRQARSHPDVAPAVSARLYKKTSRPSWRKREWTKRSTDKRVGFLSWGRSPINTLTMIKQQGKKKR